MVDWPRAGVSIMESEPCVGAESCLEPPATATIIHHQSSIKASDCIFFLLKLLLHVRIHLTPHQPLHLIQQLNPHINRQSSWCVTSRRASISETDTQLTPSTQSLRIVPDKAHPHQTALAPSAPSAPGVHDTLRSNQSLNTPHSSSPAFSAVASSHPLEARLSNWRNTQDSLKMTMLRREFGVGEPVRRGMEVQLCKTGEWRPAVLGFKGEGVHEEILAGRDETLGWEDVFTGEFCCDEGVVGDEGLMNWQAMRWLMRPTSTRRWRRD